MSVAHSAGWEDGSNAAQDRTPDSPVHGRGGDGGARAAAAGAGPGHGPARLAWSSPATRGIAPWWRRRARMGKNLFNAPGGISHRVHGRGGLLHGNDLRRFVGKTWRCSFARDPT